MKILKPYFILFFIVFATNSYGETKNKKNNPIQTILISYENDSIYGDDENYTNGVQALVTTKNNETSKENKYISKILGINDKTSHNYSFGFGQKIYTSSDIDISEPMLNDRPYAGYLYAFLNKNIWHDENIIDSIGFYAGITGEISLGESIQKTIHEWIGSPTPEGWNNQLDNEFLFMVTWMRTLKYGNPKVNEYDWYLIPRFGFDLGTPFTDAKAYIEYRYGWNLDDDLIANKIQTPSLGIRRSNSSDWSYYIFFGAEADVVFYNTFLDKSIPGQKKYIDKEWLRYELTVGLNLRYKNFYIKNSNIYMSKEYKQQDDPQIIFSITTGFLF